MADSVSEQTPRPYQGACFQKGFPFDRFIPYRRNLDVDFAHTKMFSSLSPNAKRQNSAAQSFGGDRYQEFLNAAVGRSEKDTVLPLTPKKTARRNRPSISSPCWLLENADVFFPTPRKCPRRYLASSPSRILDMPGLRNDLYTNILDWNRDNYLAVALKQTVYVWNAEDGSCRRIRVNFSQLERAFLASLAWNPTGKSLAVSTSGGEVLLLDVENTKLVISFCNIKKSPIGILAWADHGFCSGSMVGDICLHDERAPTEKVVFVGCHKYVCGLKFSNNKHYLASGGSDGTVNIWDVRTMSRQCRIRAHKSWSKALAWCPWRPSVLATGGGVDDGHIRIWHAATGEKLSETNIHSETCSLLWSSEYRELASSHGGPCLINDIALWKDRSPEGLDLVGTLHQHEGAPLHLALNSDSTTLASAGTDEIMCLWNCFPVVRKRSHENASPLSLLRTLR